jgi:hypothetical protein
MPVPGHFTDLYAVVHPCIKNNYYLIAILKKKNKRKKERNIE